VLGSIEDAGAGTAAVRVRLSTQPSAEIRNSSAARQAARSIMGTSPEAADDPCIVASTGTAGLR
jgi:hypothetical protein